MTRKIHIHKILMLCVLMVAMSFVFPMKAEALEKPTTLADSYAHKYEDFALNLNVNTYSSVTWGAGVSSAYRKIIKEDTDSQLGTIYTFAVKTEGLNKSWEKEDLVTVNFKNVGKLNGRNLNASVYVSKLNVGKYQGSNSPDDLGYMYIGSDSMGFGRAGSSEYQYKAQKKVTCKVTVTYADTGAAVGLPFLLAANDLDAGDDYFLDGVKAVSGIDRAYVFSSCNLEMSETYTRYRSGSGADSNLVDAGDIKQWTKAGVIFETTSSTFTAQYEAGNSAVSLYVIAPYSAISNPTITATQKTYYQHGDSVTYTLSQKMPVRYQTIFAPFSSYKMIITLPEGVTYTGATSSLGGNGSITRNGQTITVTANTTWLDNIASYNGQTLTLSVTGTITKPTGPAAQTETLTAAGKTQVSNLTFSAGNASVTSKNPQISLTKTVADDTYQAAENVKWTVGVTQTVSGVVGKNVVVTDTLPSGLTLTGTPSVTAGTVSVSGNKWTWTIPSLAYNSKQTITFYGKADASVAGKDVTNTASGSVSYGNSTTASAKVHIYKPEIKLTKTSNKTKYHSGETVKYTIKANQTVKNVYAKNVVVTDDDLPSGLVINMDTLKVDDSTATITKGTNSFKVTIPNLPDTKTITITFDATFDPDKLKSSDVKNAISGVANTDGVTSTASAESNIRVVNTITTEIVNGTITPTIKDIEIGEDKLVEYTPDHKHYIDQVIVDGKDAEIKDLYGDSYLFEDVRRNHTIKVICKLIKGDVKMRKSDSQTETTPQGDATFAGATFEIVSNDSDTVYVENEPYEKGDVCKILTTDENGEVQTTGNALSYGDYIIRETGAPTGYLGEGITQREFQIRWHGVLVDATDTPIKNDVMRGGVKINKRDDVTGGTPQGDATFEGTEFSIINKSANPVFVDGSSHDPGEVCKIITIKDGIAQTEDTLPYGDYTIVESKSPAGYLLEGHIEENFTIAYDGQVIDLTDRIENPVIRGGVQIQKWTIEFNKSEASTETTLEDIEFTLKNESRNAVVVEDKLYQPGEVITTLTTKWNEDKNAYTTQVPASYLPYGTYTMQETKTNSTYVLTDGEARTFQVRTEGDIVTTDTNGNGLIYKNDPVRNDIKFTKQELDVEDGISHIPFKITNIYTGETHVIVSDDNGNVDTESAWNPHSQNTNGNDHLLDMDIIKDEDMDLTAGVWFSKGEFGSKGDIIDSIGALPFGTYVMDELRCEANEDRELLEGIKFSVFRDPTTGEGVLDMGTLDNSPVTLDTSAIDSSLNPNGTSPQKTYARDNITIVDTVDYERVEPGREYALTTTAVNTATGETVTHNGKESTVTTKFTPEDAKGQLQVEVKVDAGEFAGQSVLICQHLTYEIDGTTITAAIHEDMSDRDQTIEFLEPEIITSAIDSETGAHVAYADEKVVITDSVEYSNVLARNRYVMTATLVDRETEEPVKVNGKTIEVSEEFTSNKTSGSLEMTLPEFDASELKGKTVVVYEELTWDGITIGEHKDPLDMQQVIYFPAIHTDARDSESGEKITFADSKIIDTLSYIDVHPDYEYEIEAVLMDKDTGKELLADGKPVTATGKFTTKASHGTENIALTFNTKGLEGKTAVVYETLKYNGKTVAVHHDINDEKQTIRIPKMSTSAAGDTGTKVISAGKNAEVIDTISYKNLIPDKIYTVKGILMDKSTEEPLLIDGKEVISHATFVPKSEDGETEVKFTFDSRGLEGKTFVVFETLEIRGFSIAEHKDLSDKNQTVYLSKVRTTAIDSKTNDHISDAKRKTTIIDTVYYENLVPGEYTIKGVLMDPSTGEKLKVDGEPVEQTIKFAAEGREGTVQVEFTFDATELKGKSVVVFEEMYLGDTLVGSHKDISDTSQMVHFPKALTVALDGKTNEHMAYAEEGAKFTDTVSYENVLEGREYTVEGVLVDKDAGHPVTVDGEEIKASSTFTAEGKSGKEKVTFDFDASDFAGKTIVVFERIYLHKGDARILVGMHTDIDDANQTIRFPNVYGNLVDGETKEHVAFPDGDVTVIDTITYENVMPDKDYTVIAKLIDKTTGKPVMKNGKEVTDKVTFTPDKASGTAEIKFNFDGSDFAGNSVVVFEQLFWGEHILADQENINDENETVHFPKVSTAAASQSGSLVLAGDTVITDTVKYENLQKGLEYTIEGILMDKADEKPLEINGREVTAYAKFTPDKQDGKAKVTFAFDASELEGRTVVVFEEISVNKAVVAEHKDINDEKQTIRVPEIETNAADSKTKEHILCAGDVDLTDTVTYRNLVPGEKYELNGKLIDRFTGMPVKDKDGEVVTGFAKFTANEPNGTADVKFAFNGRHLAGVTAVAFEELSWNGNVIAVHKDLQDVNQTVYFAGIDAEAIDAETKTHISYADGKTTVAVTVSYDNLIPGREYKISGQFVDKETGKPIKIRDGDAFEHVFTPDKPDGKAELEFEVDSKDLAGKTAVVFETLMLDDAVVAKIENINDEDQTIHFPEIKTFAFIDNKEVKTVIRDNVKVTDRVEYKNLIPGEMYTLTAALIDKETEMSIATGTSVFTAKESSGHEDVDIKFNAKDYNGKELVVYETLWLKGDKIADHEDINDKNQTVKVDIPTLKISKTSDRKRYDAGDTGTYTLTVETENSVAENVVIKDKFSKRGVDISEVTVMIDDEDITESCDINVKKTGFTIKTGKNLSYGEKMTVTYKVLFENVSGDLENSATASANNAETKGTGLTVNVKAETPPTGDGRMFIVLLMFGSGIILLKCRRKV